MRMKIIIIYLLSSFFSGCAFEKQFVPNVVNTSFSEQEWFDLKEKIHIADSWDNLPSPWLIKLKAKYYWSSSNSTEQFSLRISETNDFLKMINERRRQWFVEINPQLPNKIKKSILAGEVFIGMTAEQVRASWGSLARDQINRNVGNWGVHEQWVYEDLGTYLYFENGILTNLQD